MASPLEDLAPKFEQTVAAFVKDKRLPGAMAGVVHGNELVWSGGYGFADVAARRAPDAATLYRIASITKTFTATAIMQLRDEGKLHLDDPAVAYLPELRDAVSPFGLVETITIRRMLSHESGLVGDPPRTDWTKGLYESSTGDQPRAGRGDRGQRAAEHAAEVLEPRVPTPGRDRRAGLRRLLHRSRPHAHPRAARHDLDRVRAAPRGPRDEAGEGLPGPLDERRTRRGPPAAGVPGRGRWAVVLRGGSGPVARARSSARTAAIVAGDRSWPGPR